MTQFLREERGATAIEYGLIAALIAVVVIGGLSKIGTKMSENFREIAGNL